MTNMLIYRYINAMDIVGSLVGISKMDVHHPDKSERRGLITPS